MKAKARATISLGELEMAVLEHLWAHGSGDTHDVHAAIGRRRSITYNTVQSALKRLHEKKLLARAKISHAFVYSPRFSREEYGRLELRRVVDDVMGGQADSMVAAFVELTERAGSDELQRLEKLVAERIRIHKGNA